MKSPIAGGLVVSLILATSTNAAPPSTNPADLEREAFALCAVSPERLQDKNGIDAVPLDAQTTRYLESLRPAFDLLKQAATQPTADWGLGVDDMSPVLKQLNSARHAANLLWLQARLDLANDRPADAVDALVTSIAIAHHIGQENLLVCHLVEMGCESGATQRLAAILPGLPAGVIATLPAKLDALPPTAGFAAIMDGEREYGRRVIFKQLGIPATQPIDQATAPLAVQQVFALDPLYDAAKNAAAKSPAEFSAALDAAVAKMPENMFAKILAPSFARAREPSAEIEAKVAMLRTAIAVAISGPAAVDESVDPFGNGAPFIRKETPNGGYALQSHLVSRGKAVTLQVGQ